MRGNLAFLREGGQHDFVKKINVKRLTLCVKFVFRSPSRSRLQAEHLDELEKIPPYNQGRLALEDYRQIRAYLTKVMDPSAMCKVIEFLAGVKPFRGLPRVSGHP